MDTAATYLCDVPEACSSMEIDLRVPTKESRHHSNADPTMQTMPAMYQPILQQYQTEWTLSRNHVPSALAQKGITLRDWMDVFDKADALWEKRTMELLGEEVVPEMTATQRTLLRFVHVAKFTDVFIISYLGFTFLYSWFDSWLDVALRYIGCLLLGCLVHIAVFLAKQTTAEGFQEWIETLAEFEDDWSRLADEQRQVFQSFGVDVVPIKEATKTRGMCHVWTVGLRFRFDMASANNITEDTNLFMHSNGLIPDDSIQHDVDSSLQLRQIGDIETKEHHLRKSCTSILSEISTPFQYESLPKANFGSRPLVTTADMTALGADNACDDKKQVFMDIV